MMKLKLFTAALLGVTLAACGDAPDASSPREAINTVNLPELLPGASAPVERRLASLPTSGRAPNVWTGHWYPFSQGGTAGWETDATLWPLEKHDLVKGNGQASQWARTYSRQFAHVSWAGHCNGVAAAGIMLPEPRRAVTYGGVTFSVQDIKALLTEAWMLTGTVAGGRCESDAIAADAFGRPVDPACRDANPGAFHVALGSFLGRDGRAIIIDKSPGVQVWNYPVTAYASTVTTVTPQQAATLVGANGAYPFNAMATSFARVQTRIELVTGEAASYQYLLELDAQGRIVGGEWLGSSKRDHPDFFWRPTAPAAANPHLDLALVNTLHQLSL